MKIPICTAVLVFLFVVDCSAQNLPWLEKMKRIEVLKSSETDVEKIFGKPTERFSIFGDYELADGRLSFQYSRGKCSIDEDSEYDVEKGTIVKIHFQTGKMIKFKSLKLNLAGFKKRYSSDATDTFTYENAALGISYVVSNGWLNSIFIEPSRNYAYLACTVQTRPSKRIVEDIVH
jgi:hypothetical protein